MKVYLDEKNPLAPEPELEITELVLMPENEIDQHRCAKVFNNYETSGCGFSRDGQLTHVSIKLTEKQKEDHAG